MKNSIFILMPCICALTLASGSLTIVNFEVGPNAQANTSTLFSNDANNANWEFRDYNPLLSSLQNTENLFINGAGGTNNQVYGGFTTSWANANEGYSPNPRYQNNAEFIINVHGGGANANNMATGILLWNKVHFLNGADAQTVNFSNGSTLRVNVGATTASTRTEYRFVVNQDGNYYVSDDLVEVSGNWTITIDDSTLWRTVSTDGNYTIGSTPSTLTLGNLSGVGVYIDAERLDSSAQLIARFSEFEAVAIPEPKAMATVLAIGALAFLSLRRRHR